VLDAKGRLVLWVGGAANKNREVFEERFRKLTEKLEQALKNKPQESREEEREATLAV